MSTTATRDPRLDAVVMFENQDDPAGKRIALVVWPGATGTAYHRGTMRIKAAVDECITAAQDAEQSRGLSPREAQAKAAAAGAKALAVVSSVGSELQASRSRVGTQLHSFSSVTSYENAGVGAVMFDLHRARQFEELRSDEQAALVFQADANPMSLVPLGEASLRLPPDIAPLKGLTREKMRVALAEAFRPTDFAALEHERLQLNAAELVAFAAVQTIGEVAGVYPTAEQSGAAAYRAEPQALEWIDPAMVS
jgi:hypothetical protein